VNAFRVPCHAFLNLQGKDNLLFIYYQRSFSDQEDTPQNQPTDLPSLAAEAARLIAYQASSGWACLIALDLTTNKKLWESKGWSSEVKPIIFENKVILGRAPGGITALDIGNGAKLWESDWYQPNSGSTEMAIDQASSTGEEKENVFKAISFATGQQVWKTALFEFNPLTLDGSSKLCSVGKETYFLLLPLAEDKPPYKQIETILCAGNKSTGQPLWQDTFENQKALCPPLLTDDKVFIVTALEPPKFTNGIYAISAKDGKKIWSQSMKIDPAVVPTIIGNEMMLSVQDNEGAYAINGLDINSGNVKWQYAGNDAKDLPPGLTDRFDKLSFSQHYIVYLNHLRVCALKR
jgi:outer membrane protein assembly factor BamB